MITNKQIKADQMYQKNGADLQCDQNVRNQSNNIPNQTKQISNHCSRCQFRCYSKPVLEQDEQLDALQKKRQKRRQHKKRQKIKRKQAKEEAFKILEEIICDIYQLKTDFNQQRATIEKCLDLDRNEDRFYEFINTVIREQVDVIRQETQNALNDINAQQSDFSMVPRLFEQFTKIKQASPEVEKIINLFIRKAPKKKNQTVPLHKNLDRMTFKFILRNDQEDKNHFENVCRKLCKSEHTHQREKQMLKIMVETLNQHQIDQDFDNYDSDVDEDCENSTSYSSEESQKITTKDKKENQDYQQITEISNQFSNHKSQLKKNKKKKHNKMDYQMDYEVVLQRIEDLCFHDEQRIQCNVEDSWLQRISEKTLQIHKFGYKIQDPQSFVTSVLHHN